MGNKLGPAGQISVGIIGAHPHRGWALHAHVPALRALPLYSINAVAAKDQATADAAARVFGASASFSDPLSLAASPIVDLVAVCVRVPGHLEAVDAALSAGKHVYCEWPLGRDFAETIHMRDAAVRSGIHHAIGLQGRHSPAVQTARRLILEGALGRVLSARMYSASNGWGAVVQDIYAYTTDRSTGATMLTITGGHSLDTLSHILGPVESVSAMLTTQHPEVRIHNTKRTIHSTSPDNIALLSRHRDGCLSSVFITGGRPPDGRFSLHIHGTEGHIFISTDELGDFQIAKLSISGVTKHGPIEFAASQSCELPGAAANVRHVYEKLANDMASGSTSVANFDDALKLASLIEAIQQSSDSGRVQRLAAT